MKAFRILVIFAFVTTLFSSSLLGQEIIKCDSSKTYWLIKKDSILFSTKINGVVENTERKSVIKVNKNVALQFLVVDKNKFLPKEQPITNQTILIQYALSEAEYLSSLFKTRLNVQFQKVPFSEDRFAILWFYDMPEGMNQQVKSQLYLNIVIGEYIFGLSSPLFRDQKFEEIRNLLTETISTARITKSIDEICNE